MPRNRLEEGYGDELDRMRARRRQKRGSQPAAADWQGYRGPFYDEEDEDLQGSYLEEDWEGEEDLEEEDVWPMQIFRIN